jgi:ERCC4-related helicase
LNVTTNSVIAPGANIEVRDAAWRVRRVDRTSSGDLAIEAVGLSELVQDKEAVFLREYEEQYGDGIDVLDPAETELVSDDSHQYQASLLYLESQLRRVPPTDDDLYVGHQAAMDKMEYQLEPAAQALEQPRQRLLIADAVGLGKTVEAGILLSELIARGKGKRILVVGVKRMLTQLQKEFWSRFTIPLVRLDSLGLERIRRKIPTNQNPFYYYDKSIISIDTLKQNNEYRTYLEDAHWDIIVIDEAQHVAHRGRHKSQRAELAELLSHRSDSLVMLSATPHDGRAKSFASLMNMLDPTAIADEENYEPEDIDGLFIRRFKKDVADQVSESFPDREIVRVSARASDAEERAYQTFVDLDFSKLDTHGGGHMLFKTKLEKSMLSSPPACIQTIDTRIQRLERKDNVETYRDDIEALEDLREDLAAIDPESYAKYQRLVELFEGDSEFHFTGWRRDDRMVVFTERIPTMEWLAEHLPESLDLAEKKVATLHGGMSDIEQQEVVEAFGKEKADVRLLIASDVASEGINLHYFCHRMVHFDIPWSLMVFQQRNGRIDRYGQTEQPHIAYLYTEADNDKIMGDTRILEVLMDKDEQASKNIGDPSALMGVYDIEDEERQTAEAIESDDTTADAFDEQLQEMDVVSQMLEAAEDEDETGPTTDHLPSLYPGDFDYLEHALEFLREERSFDFESDPERRRIALGLSEDLDDLDRRFDKIPDEVDPDDGRVVLTADTDAMQTSIENSRAEETAWPNAQYLWRLNPVVQWADDRMAGNFGRHTAPVIVLDAEHDLEGRDVEPGERIVLMSGLIPNQKSQPLVHRWFGAVFQGDTFERLEPFEEVRRRTGLGEADIPNRGEDVETDELEELLPEAVEYLEVEMKQIRRDFEADINEDLNDHLEELEDLKERQLDHQRELFEDQTSQVARERHEQKKREIKRLFDEYFDWIEKTMTTEDTPFIQVLAVIVAERGG